MKNSVVAWCLWLCVAWVGMLALANHDSRPGLSAQAPPRWPKASRLPFSGEKPVLLFFVHPLCPCSQASLAELSRLRGASKVAFQVVGVIGIPEGLAERQGERMAANLVRIGAQARIDMNLEESQRFGCYTSGQALLYSPQGRLCYQGGLTGSRGHEGDNDGKTAVLRALEGCSPGLASQPVFGCCMRGSEP